MSKPEIGGKKPIVGKYDAGEYWWCTCGRSANQPFCDGSHKGSAFSPMKVVLEADKKCAWCTCKLTEKGPYCDGAHRELREK